MSIFKKRLATILALFIACVSFVALGLVSLPKPEPAYGASLPTITNIETKTLQSFVQDVSGSVKSISTVDAWTGGSHQLYATYKSKTEDSTNSISKYNGNLSLTYDKGSASSVAARYGVRANVGTSGVLAFRTNYQGWLKLQGQVRDTYGPRYGYIFTVDNDGFLLQTSKDTSANELTTVLEAAYDSNATISVGDDLIITYGAVALEDKGNSVYLNEFYLKVVKVDANGNQTVLCDRLSNPISSNGQDTYGVGGTTYMYISTHNSLKLLIGGVDKPLTGTVAGGVDYEGATGKAGEKLSSVSLPDGYSFVNPNAVIRNGVMEYDGYDDNASYYEKKAVVKITVTPTDIVAPTVTKIDNVAMDSFAWGAAFRTVPATEGKYNVATGHEMYASYKSNTEDATNSVSKYSGNLTLAYNGSAANYGVRINTGKNGVLSFRTSYQGAIKLLGQVRSTATPNYGYEFSINQNGFVLKASKDTSANPLLTVIDSAYDNSSTISVGDDLIITYGAVVVEDKGNWTYVNDFYLKVSKIDNDGNETVLCDRLSKPIVTDKISCGVNNVDYMYILVANSSKLMFGGVDAPLNGSSVSAGKNFSTTGQAGQALSSISLPSRYTFADPTAIIRNGVMDYDGFDSSASYYEKKDTLPVKITVTPTGVVAPSVTKLEEISAYPYVSVSGGGAAGIVVNNIAQNLSGLDELKNVVNGHSLYATLKSSNEDATNSNSISKYVGNLSLSYTNQGSEASRPFFGASIGTGDTSFKTDYVISFRTSYQGYPINLLGQIRDNPYPNNSLDCGGYVFSLTETGYTLKTGNNAVIIATTYASDMTLSNGDQLLVTFGAVPVAGTEDSEGALSDFYLKVVKVNSSNNEVVLCDHLTTPLSSNERTSYVGTPSRMFVTTSTDAKLLLGGVDAPFRTINSDYFDVTATEDQPLSSLSLGGIYSWSDPSSLFVADQLAYDALLDNYYGFELNDYAIKVTIKGVDKLESRDIKLSYNGGETLVRVKENAPYTFEEFVGDENKLFIGWVYNGKLYPAGYQISYANVQDNMVFELAEIGFALEVGASVRYKVDENGQAGMRFTLNINKADFEKYSAFISLNDIYSAIVPTDTYVNAEGELLDIPSAFKTALNVEDGTIKTEGDVVSVAFAITNIAYSNFNRDFSGVAYLNVNYETGAKLVATDYNKANNSRSVYDVALKLLDNHAASLNNNDEFAGTLSENQVEILGNYVNQTVDIVLTEDKGTNKITIEKADALDKGYANVETDDSYTVELYSCEYNDGSYEVTITVTFAEGYELGTGFSKFTESQGEQWWQIPVTVRVSDGTVIKGICRLGVNGAVVANGVVDSSATTVAQISFIYTSIN